MSTGHHSSDEDTLESDTHEITDVVKEESTFDEDGFVTIPKNINASTDGVDSSSHNLLCVVLLMFYLGNNELTCSQKGIRDKLAAIAS